MGINETERELEPTVRPRRRRRRFAAVAVVLCVLSLFATLTLWASRVSWRTFVSKPTTSHPGYALQFQLPADWECKQTALDDTVQGNVNDRSVLVVGIQRKRPGGLARWWEQQVLRRSYIPLSADDCLISMDILPVKQLSRGDANQEIADEEQRIQKLSKWWGKASLGNKRIITFRTFEHPLGPALNTCFMPLSTRQNAGAVDDWIECAAIWWHGKQVTAQIHVRHRREAYAEFQRIGSIWDEIVRSIRVVQK